MYANDHPYKVTAVDSASITANDHPFKVLIEGGVVTPEQFAELEAKVDALATDLTFKGSVETYDDLPETADDGDTYLVTSTGILYTFVNNNPIPLNEGVNVVQTTGTSTTDVMSQNAVTSMVYADPGARQIIKIGNLAVTGGNTNAVAIGYAAKATSDSRYTSPVAIGAAAEATGNYAVAIGNGAHATASGAIALGRGSSATVQGEINVGTSLPAAGYNNSAYRLLTGLYDGQSAHDAATVGQLTPAFTNAEFNSIFNTSLTEA